MQVDAAPEENDNVEDVQYMVESTSLVNENNTLLRYHVNKHMFMLPMHDVFEVQQILTTYYLTLS